MKLLPPFRYFLYFILALLVAFPVLFNLGAYPIRLWDESRLAMNAYEMFTNGHWIVTHFEGKPDMWNTKPPLMIWLQVLSMHLIGINEWALRLPSAIAALLTFLVLFTFISRYTKLLSFAVFTVLALVTTHGYVGFHVTRTGDYDSLLILFTTTYCLAFFYHLHTRQNKYLYLTAVALILATLTKGIAALLFLPTLLCYTIWQRHLVDTLINKHFYVCLCSFLIICGSYYLVRDHYNPGYINAMTDNEWGGRFLEPQENRTENLWFYIHNFKVEGLRWWYAFAPVGMIIALRKKASKEKQLLSYTFLLIIVFFIIITIAQTKLSWYSAPLYPFLAVFTGSFIHTSFHYIKQLKLRYKQYQLASILAYGFVTVLFIIPYTSIARKTVPP